MDHRVQTGLEETKVLKGPQAILVHREFLEQKESQESLVVWDPWDFQEL